MRAGAECQERSSDRITLYKSLGHLQPTLNIISLGDRNVVDIIGISG